MIWTWFFFLDVLKKHLDIFFRQVITACEKGGVWELAVRILAASSQLKVHRPGDRSQFTCDGDQRLISGIFFVRISTSGVSLTVVRCFSNQMRSPSMKITLLKTHPRCRGSLFDPVGVKPDHLPNACWDDHLSRWLLT